MGRDENTRKIKLQWEIYHYADRCCVRDSGICDCTLLRISRSRIFDEVQRREIGRKDAGSFGGLLGFNSGMIFASFHKFGILLCSHE